MTTNDEPIDTPLAWVLELPEAGATLANQFRLAEHMRERGRELFHRASVIESEALDEVYKRWTPDEIHTAQILCGKVFRVTAEDGTSHEESAVQLNARHGPDDIVTWFLRRAYIGDEIEVPGRAALHKLTRLK